MLVTRGRGVRGERRKMKGSGRLVAIGECMVEFGPAPGHPGLYRQGFAGDTFNTAWHFLRQAEGWSVDYLSALGDDEASTAMLDWMARNGIGTEHVAILPGRTPGLYVIAVEDGERRFSYWRSDSAARRLADDLRRLANALDGANAVYLSGITLAILTVTGREALLAALAGARRDGAVIAFDTNIRPALWRSTDEMAAAIRAMAAITDILLPSFGDEAATFGDANPEATARRYAAMGAVEVVVKDGPGPVTTLRDDQLQTHRGRAVRAPVDTTGAGDAFNAGYLAARLRGAEIFEAVARARFLAEEVIMYPGALPASAG